MEIKNRLKYNLVKIQKIPFNYISSGEHLSSSKNEADYIFKFIRVNYTDIS